MIDAGRTIGLSVLTEGLSTDDRDRLIRGQAVQFMVRREVDQGWLHVVSLGPRDGTSVPSDARIIGDVRTARVVLRAGELGGWEVRIHGVPVGHGRTDLLACADGVRALQTATRVLLDYIGAVATDVAESGRPVADTE